MFRLVVKNLATTNLHLILKNNNNKKHNQFNLDQAVTYTNTDKCAIRNKTEQLFQSYNSAATAQNLLKVIAFSKLATQPVFAV